MPWLNSSKQADAQGPRQIPFLIQLFVQVLQADLLHGQASTRSPRTSPSPATWKTPLTRNTSPT